MTNPEQQQSELVELLKSNGASLVGFGDVSDIDPELTFGFSTAISIAVHYDSKIVSTLDTQEEQFHKHMESLNEPVLELIKLTEKTLHYWGHRSKSIAIPKTIESNKQLEELKIFPQKTAATKAGLGWIGKSALFITHEFGPQVKLATIFTNAKFKTATPITENNCGDCQNCVTACPCKAIKNVGWHAGIEREKLINVYDCNTYRLNFISTMGRKHSCGLCIKVCKFSPKK